MSVDKESSYYDIGGIETIAIIKAKLTPEQYEGFLLGCILKYPSRANHKGSFDRDIQKTVVYSSLLEEYRKERNEQKTDTVQDSSTREEIKPDYDWSLGDQSRVIYHGGAGDRFYPSA